MKLKKEGEVEIKPIDEYISIDESEVRLYDQPNYNNEVEYTTPIYSDPYRRENFIIKQHMQPGKFYIETCGKGSCKYRTTEERPFGLNEGYKISWNNLGSIK